eukprot:3917464-Rhodomonas_salina.2
MQQPAQLVDTEALPEPAPPDARQHRAWRRAYARSERMRRSARIARAPRRLVSTGHGLARAPYA